MRGLALLLLAGCSAYPVKVLAHRGSGKIDGTVAGAEHSIAMGVQILEMDVRLTKDGRAVILHDGTVDRTTDGKGPVAGMTLEELKKLDAGVKFGSPGERVPTVVELLTAVNGRAWVTLELKVVEAADRVVDAIREARAFDWAVVRSPDLDRLAALRKAEPRLLTGAMAPWPEDPAAFAKRLAGLGIAAYTPGSNAPLTRYGVVRFQAERILVWATLCNDEDEMRRLAGLGVDGIITDRPDRLLEVLRSG
jgi:glycerophosphoryl diester phosphodiesterase